MKFKVGDRVRVYNSDGSSDEQIKDILSDDLILTLGEEIFHHKQCRRLVKKKKEKTENLRPIGSEMREHIIDTQLIESQGVLSYKSIQIVETIRRIHTVSFKSDNG